MRNHTTQELRGYPGGKFPRNRLAVRREPAAHALWIWTIWTMRPRCTPGHGRCAHVVYGSPCSTRCARTLEKLPPYCPLLKVYWASTPPGVRPLPPSRLARAGGGRSSGYPLKDQERNLSQLWSRLPVRAPSNPPRPNVLLRMLHPRYAEIVTIVQKRTRLLRRRSGQTGGNTFIPSKPKRSPCRSRLTPNRPKRCICPKMQRVQACDLEFREGYDRLRTTPSRLPLSSTTRPRSIR